jgi:hypothetical protein
MNLHLPTSSLAVYERKSYYFGIRVFNLPPNIGSSNNEGGLLKLQGTCKESRLTTEEQLEVVVSLQSDPKLYKENSLSCETEKYCH